VSATFDAGGDSQLDTRLHDLSAERLVRRYRALLWWVATPVFLLLASLAAWQARGGYLVAVAEFERSLIAPHAELQALARALGDHVADLRKGSEADRLAPPRAPDAALRDWLEPHPGGGWTLDGMPSLMRPGLAQLFWPGSTPPPEASLWRLQSLSQVAERAHNRTSEFAASFEWDWPEHQLVLYPWLPSKEALAANRHGNLGSLLVARYAGEPFLGGTPDRNPSRLPYWSAPVPDLEGQRQVVVHAAPVWIGDDFRGIVGAEVRVDALARVLDGLRAASHTRWWLIDAEGRAIVEGGDAGAGLAPPSPTELDTALRTPGSAQSSHGRRLVALPLTHAPWSLALAVGEGRLVLRMLPGLAPLVLIAAALVAMFLYGQQLLRRRVIEPALTIMGYLHARSIDDRAVEPKLSARWQPWVEVVTSTFEAQRAARQRERRSEAFKSAVVDQALAAIVTVDAKARVVEWNAAAEDMFGWPRAMVIGHEVADFVAPEHRRHAHADGLERSAGRRSEFTALRADGTPFPVEMQVNKIEVDGVTHYSAFLVDVSARVQAAAEIERQREALRQSEKLSAMGGLLAGVAHELNNPLAIVLGRASLLESKAEGGDIADDARRIREAAERCARIVRSFLNMARSRPAERHAVQLNDLVRAAMDLLAYSLRTSGVAVELVLDDALPAVQADEDRIGQLLMNLVVNAQQALSNHIGERRLRVETGLELRLDGGRFAWLRVADSGPGIAADNAEQVFTPYFTTKVEGAGTGLGLAVARTVAREHGGDLVLESPGPLPGACFRFHLPLAAAEPVAVDDDGTITGMQPATQRLLVVDDEPEFAEMLRETLEGAGYEVATAESGAVALELLAEARFDAIVSDLRMPDMDGHALWREVHQRHPPLARRMLFVTGDTLSPTARQTLEASGCEALEKPFAPAELLRRMRWLLVLRPGRS